MDGEFVSIASSNMGESPLDDSALVTTYTEEARSAFKSVAKALPEGSIVCTDPGVCARAGRDL